MAPTTTTKLATADLTTLGFVHEVAFGVTPAANAQLMRYTKHSFKATNSSERSKDLRGDRQTGDIKRVSVGATGAIDVEMSADTHDEMMLAAMCAPNIAFSAMPTANNPVSTATVATTGVLSGTGVGTNVAVGDFVFVAGFTDSGNNGYFRVVSASANSLTVDPKPSSDETVAASGATVQPLSSEPNGVDFNSFSFVETRKDLTNVFTLGSGFVLDKWSLDAKVQSVITMNFDFIGKDWVPSATNGDFTGETAATTNDMMTTVDEVIAFVYGTSGSAATVDVESFNFSVANNMRERLNLGDAGMSSAGLGKFIVTGSMNAYFQDSSLMTAFTSDQDNLRCAFIVKDAAGETYIFDFPRIKFTDGTAANDGENSDTMSQMTFEAIAEVATGQTMFIHKLVV